MKELRGTARAAVSASRAACLALVRDVAGYPRWYPEVVREAELITPASAADPTLVQATLRARLGPLERDFELLLEVSSEGDGVLQLTRIPNDPADRERLSLVWRVDQGDTTELCVEISARLDVPRLLPVHGAGDAMARGFVAAARRALRDRD